MYSVPGEGAEYQTWKSYVCLGRSLNPLPPALEADALRLSQWGGLVQGNTTLAKFDWRCLTGQPL